MLTQFSVHFTVTSTSPYFHYLLYGNVVGGRAKDFTEVRLYVHCCPLIKQASHFIMEDCQVGQVTDTLGRQQMDPKILIGE